MLQSGCQCGVWRPAWKSKVDGHAQLEGEASRVCEAVCLQARHSLVAIGAGWESHPPVEHLCMGL
eukprot:8972601-Karenia_brevis.AAC.1